VASRRFHAPASPASPAAAALLPALSSRVVKGIVSTVLAGEGRTAEISVTFVGPARMRALNLEWKQHDRPTDVLAFALPLPGGGVTGDVYVCPAVARAEARARAIAPRQELIRLVVHGTLHVLGYDHPEGPGRTRSAMWRRQERYVKALT
jgi:probable rRNA maturation factor